MNAVMDLTARAVAVITAVQTMLLKGAIAANREGEEISILNTTPEDFEQLFQEFVSTDQQKHSERGKDAEEDSFAARAVELVWIRGGEADPKVSVEYTIFLSLRVKEWINKNKDQGIQRLKQEYGAYPTPFNWRETIKKILCDCPKQRLALATALQYLPIQVVLAVGGTKFDLREQRVMQIWNMEEAFRKKFLTIRDMQTLRTFDELQRRSTFSLEELLKEDKTLVDQLLHFEAPLSFEQVFASELDEIALHRDRRNKEHCVTTEGAENMCTVAPSESDPYQAARKMHLCGLALSGGGIRSATFNLGIMQGLAGENLIGRFDYLSTVSGGGYIGSWLAGWIKREGSVVKVTDRLCTDKSPEPLGEELRPIRWLRMYSNYFAPRVSKMSADTWTIAITWLRNTLLNQVIIFLLLLAVLFCGNFIFQLWADYLRQPVHGSTGQVVLYSILSLLPIAGLAGLGMHAYTRNKIRWIPISPVMTNVVKYGILGVAIVAAYFLSAWMCSPWYVKNFDCREFADKFLVMIPAAFTAFACLLLVAWIGKYHELIIRASGRGFVFAWTVIGIASCFTAGVGLISLATGWTLLQNVADTKNEFIRQHIGEIEFIIGLPVILEVFSITLVARMALMGRYFPDERREWWGRMGALVHRFSFLWIIVGTSALLGKDVMDNFFENDFPKVMTALGGWVVLVGSAVRTAFSSKVSGNKESGSNLSMFLNFFSLIGPYVFLLGLLVFLPALIPLLNLLANTVLRWFSEGPVTPMAQVLLLIIFSTGIAFALANRIGVNEFSMHHFYRNRLVRAYLGATRRDTDRRRSYNPFTNFDMNDDIFLSTMQSVSGYNGPYPILNAALNASQVADLDRQDRKAESFIFSPLYCGFDFSMIKASTDLKVKSYEYAYRPTAHYGYRNGPTVGTAMAISGAAVNPNHGYHTSPATSFLLTVFNVQMGWWMGNPRKSSWRESEPVLGIGYIIANLLGRTSTRDRYVALSDGGHFDNMGLYELVRRRCPLIMLCDAEQDSNFTCEGFANAIRRCRIDFGADIRIDISAITTRNGNQCSSAHYAVGSILYAGDSRPTGKIIYVKSSITGDEPIDVQEYGTKNDTFPHQSTADQFFDEEQFESYRKLGMHIAGELLSDPKVRPILP